MVVTTPTLEDLIRRTHRLVSLPAVALEVLRLTEGPAVDQQALKSAIEKDPALSVKLLKVVNSALFGLSSRVQGLQHAVTLLGAKPLKMLVLGFSLPEGLFAGTPAAHLSRYWRLALTKAVAAREISEQLFAVSGDDAFLAGLLQDIGMLVLMQQLGGPYFDMLESAEHQGDELSSLEMECFGFDHVHLSVQLLDRWEIPKSLVAAMAAPRSIASLRGMTGPQASIAQSLHVAHLLAELVAWRRLSVLPELLEAGDAYCGMTRDRLMPLVERLEATVLELAEILSLKLPEGACYTDLLAEAHARLAKESSEMITAGLRARIDDHPLPEEWLESARHLVPLTGAGQARIAVSRSDRQIDTTCRDKDATHGSRTAVDPLLLRRLAAMVTGCRTRRAPLSLLLIEAVQPRTANDLADTGETEASWDWPRDATAEMDHPDSAALRVGPSQYAVILPCCDRSSAVEVAHEIVRRIESSSHVPSQDSPQRPVVRIGLASVAVPPKNFPSSRLVESAERCLSAARSGLRSSVKSIEVY
jgi:HD-like signal output (HDOD) protein